MCEMRLGGMQREARAVSDPHSHPGIHPSALQERRIATNTHTMVPFLHLFSVLCVCVGVCCVWLVCGCVCVRGV